MLWRSTFAPALWNSPACWVSHTGALPVTFWLEASRTAVPAALGLTPVPADAAAAAEAPADGFAAEAGASEALAAGLDGGAGELGAVPPDGAAEPPQPASDRMTMAGKSPLARVRRISIAFAPFDLEVNLTGQTLVCLQPGGMCNGR
jgi:hypothetical protein